MDSVEVTAREQGSEGRGYKDEVEPLLPPAEQCLAAMKTRIQITHGVSKMFAGKLSDKLIVIKTHFGTIYAWYFSGHSMPLEER